MTSASVKLLRTQSDERLAALAAAGYERAFEAIVERYRRPLLRHCRRYLPEARAEDALQQALVSAWSGLRRGDEVRELRPWLHRIVHNTSLNALRATGYDYEQLRDTLEGDGGPAELAERAAVVRQALAGLAALPERQREALLQIAVEGRTQEEVAEDLGLSHGAVRQLVHRARSRLRTAATALTPLPLAGWLASGGDSRGDLVARVAELVAGAGGGATLAKAGAVAAVAGSAVGAPVVIDVAGDRPVPEQRSAIAAPAKAGDERAENDAADGAPVAVAAEEQKPGPAEPAALAGDDDERQGASGEGDDDDDGGGGAGGRDEDDSDDGSGRGGDDDDGDGGSSGDDDGGAGDDDGGDDDGGGDAAGGSGGGGSGAGAGGGGAAGGSGGGGSGAGAGGGGAAGGSGGGDDGDGDGGGGAAGGSGGGGSGGGAGSTGGGGGDDDALEPGDDGPAPGRLEGGSELGAGDDPLPDLLGAAADDLSVSVQPGVTDSDSDG